MGSRSSKGQKQTNNETWKGFRGLGSRGKPKRGTPSTAGWSRTPLSVPEQCATPHEERSSVTCAHSVASTSATIHEEEKSDKRNSNSQRVLPSIPRSAKEPNLDGTYPIRLSAPLNNLGGYACVTQFRRVTAPASFAQSSSYQANNGGADAATDYESEDSDNEYCPGKESVESTLDDNDQDENYRNVKFIEPPENTNSFPVLTRKSSDATYMQISGLDLTDVNQADGMNRTTDDDYKAPVDKDEGELAGIARVPGDDYAVADFNLNMTRANLLPKKTLHAIMGPASSRRVHEDVILFPVQLGTNGALSGPTGSAVQVKKTKAIILWMTEFAPEWGRINLHVVLGCLEDAAQQKMVKK